jgi:alpha-L-fucosidase
MTGRSVRYLFMSACFFWASMAHGDSVLILCPSDVPAIQFAASDLQQTLERQGSRAEIVSRSRLSSQQKQTRFVLGLIQDDLLLRCLREANGKSPGKLAPEGYAIRLTRHNNWDTVWAIGSDATGAMYAGLALAETIAQEGVKAVEQTDCEPYIGKRGLKMNIPLDARTPSYADCGDAAQKNIAVMWDMEFWKAQLDHMARHRYNTVTLWTPHPFPSLVKVPEYPDVALDDVKIADINWREWFPKYAGGAGAHSVTKEILENLKTVKKITIQEKIAFWRDVMQYGHDRGIEFHIITWNIFSWAAEGKYGITNSIDSEAMIDYLRRSVRCVFETYPLLAGIGVTAGENMKGLSPDEKEQWLWKTYGMGVMDAKKAFPGRSIRFIHRYWQSKIPEITKHFEGFDDDVEFNFSFKYAKARLYANTHPGFVDKILRSAPKGTKWWWNLRNDDIFYFRWGDADYVRDFINRLPPAEQTEGFHMGSDGYIWGREFVSTEPDSPRQLEIDKHWYNFMLWGRLGYDPTLSNGFFEKAMQQRFPGKPTQKLQTAWSRASKIIPAVNREHWHDWDYQWAVEACSGRLRYHAITDECWKPGGTKVANEIQGHADFVLQELVQLRRSKGDKAWQRTLSDMEAMAHLGNYYAEKLRAAETKETNTEQAIVHLKKALVHWKHYAKIGQTLYKSQLLSRAGLADWQQGCENAQKDIVLLGGSLDSELVAEIDPNWESMAANYAPPEWLVDGKIGVWTHWGVPSSVDENRPNDGSHYGRRMYGDKDFSGTPTAQSEMTRKLHEWHEKTYGPVEEFGYEDLVPNFKAEKWDPEALVQFFKDNGARFIMPVATHHDNFDMYDSFHPWNAVDMGPRRDTLKAWKAAAHKHGLKFGVSTHLYWSPRFFKDARQFQKPGTLAWKLFNMDFDPRGYASQDSWNEHWYARCWELIEKYDPDMFNNDSPYPSEKTGKNLGLKLFTDFLNRDRKENQGKQSVVLSFKDGRANRAAFTYNLERGSSGVIQPNPWMWATDVSGGWFYRKGAVNRMSIPVLVGNAVDAISKNGIVMLNVALRGDGTLPANQAVYITAVGDFMKINGEGIYGSRPWKVHGEGPLEIKTGRQGENKKPYSQEDIRFTTKDGNLYAFVMAPLTKDVVIKTLSRGGPYEGKIRNISMLGSAEKLEWKRTSTGLTIKKPRQLPDQWVIGFEITGH